MRWNEGQETVDLLLREGDLEKVFPDKAIYEDLLSAAQRHLDSAEKIREADPEGAFALLYDAARKAGAALLQAQGLRPTSKGGHRAVREAIEAQFGRLPGGGAIRAFDQLRRRRREVEYPSADVEIDSAELEHALERAANIVEYAAKVADELSPF